jgi:hypothetical protein
MTIISKIGTDLLEQIKQQCHEEISMRREEFCTRLMIAGLGPDKIYIEENFSIDGEGMLIFTCVAKRRDSDEVVDLNAIKPSEETDIWKNEDFLSWFEMQSEQIKTVVKRFPPNELYKMDGNDIPVQLRAYIESQDEKEFAFDVVLLQENSFKTIQNVPISKISKYKPN